MRGLIPSKVRVFSLMSALAVLTVTVGAPQPARAEVNWMSILSPIAEELVLPVMQKKVNAWQAKRKNKNQETATESNTEYYNEDSSNTGSSMDWDDWNSSTQ